MAAAFDAGGRLFVMGNGGSACDAQHVAVEFMHPIIEKRRPLPAMALATDTALLTAVGNDRTSPWRSPSSCGSSPGAETWRSGSRRAESRANVIRALGGRARLGLLTVGFAGRDGGRMPELCDHCFMVPSFSIHRIQETHATLLHVLWDLVHVIRGEEDVM